jgi:hypothetical protein
MSLAYQVPGLIVSRTQPTALGCWAAAYIIMRSWKDQASYDIRTAVAKVGDKYAALFDNDQALPPHPIGRFLIAAGMTHEPMENLTVEGWSQLGQSVGLRWVGTLISPSPRSGLHSRIIQGMTGDGAPDGTFMSISDPFDGSNYSEVFSAFIAKYEGAFQSTGSDQYFQIRHH